MTTNASDAPTLTAKHKQYIQEFGANPGHLRRLRKESQYTFWGRYGITQSAGSRYEGSIDGRRNMPETVGILACCYLLNFVSDAQCSAVAGVLRIKTPANATTTPAQELSDKQKQLIRDFARNPGHQRKLLKENQAAFWGRFGVTQSGGSRYECAADRRRDMPPPVAMLACLYLLGFVADAECRAIGDILRAGQHTRRLVAPVRRSRSVPLTPELGIAARQREVARQHSYAARRRAA